jgi:hypothetical protein
MPASLNSAVRAVSVVMLSALATSALAGPLDGKSYIIELSSTQYSSGYGEFLVPPLAAALDASGMRPKNGPGADVVVNIITESDVGQWIGQGDAREWIYTVDITVGISPESYMIPLDGTPVFGVRARLLTPNSDRTDELECLTRLATRTAVANFGKTGVLKTDGSSCLRK